MSDKRGFTLIELMIVVAIIGILAALAIPDFMKMMAKAKQSEAKSNLSAVFTAQVAYYGENARFADTIGRVFWQPAGQNYYTYWIASQSISSKKGDLSHPCFSTDPGSQVTAKSFTMYATANIDSDETCDVWKINDSKDLRCNPCDP